MNEIKTFGHNIIGILFSIKGLIEGHILQTENRVFKNTEARLQNAEMILKKVHLYAHTAIQITKRFGEELREIPSKYGLSDQVHIESCWQRVLERLAGEFDMKRFEILSRIPADFPYLHCSRKDFEEILYLLASNALQAMQNEGKLVLRAQLGFSMKEEQTALITLADTGPGIPEERLSSLFRPFCTTKQNGEGSGLGLYLAKELIRKNRGSLALSSFENCGTTLSLNFPIASTNSFSKPRYV
jgi:signal transduction histidine kinase